MARILDNLLAAAAQMDRSDPSWLLDAVELSDAIAAEVLADKDLISRLQQALRTVAVDNGCGIVVGASAAAEAIVRGMQQDATDADSAVVFELVRVTGATIDSTRSELRHMKVVPAVLCSVAPSRETAAQDLVQLAQLIGC